MDIDERKKTVDYIVNRIPAKGTLVSNSGLKIYEVGLKHCSLTVMKPNSPNLGSIIDIALNFGDSNIKLADNDTYFHFDGLRTLYRGSGEGLREVVLQGFFFPDQDGNVGSAGEKLIRSNNYYIGLTPNDHNNFDRYLLYVSNELKK